MKKIIWNTVFVLLPLLVSGNAAVLTGSVNVDPALGVNLTSGGTLDWALWDSTSSSTSATRAPSNEKSGGPLLISDITPYATEGTVGNVRGAAVGNQEFTYSDGTSPVSATADTIGMVINSQLDTVGKGIQLSITGDPTKIYTINIWATGYDGVGTLTASLTGATPVVLLTDTFGTTKDSVLFTFTFRPDLVTDLLNINYVLSTNGGSGTSSHVGIQAVTMSVIPEPAMVTLLGLAGLVLALRRRR